MLEKHETTIFMKSRESKLEVCKLLRNLHANDRAANQENMEHLAVKYCQQLIQILEIESKSNLNEINLEQPISTKKINSLWIPIKYKTLIKSMLGLKYKSNLPY